MNKRFYILLLLIPFNVFSQDCDCVSKFEWVKSTFEKNDAGFTYSVEKKGIKQYENHNLEYRNRISKINTDLECYELMREWMTFFRKGHFGIRPLKSTKTADTKNAWEMLPIELVKFKAYLNKKKKPDYEGIWKSSSYTIAIKKINKQYKGSVIEATSGSWKTGEIKLRIYDDSTVSYYMGNYSERKFDKVELLGNNYLKIGRILFKRAYPDYESQGDVERYYKSISAKETYLDQLSDNTLFLRIPSFDGSKKREIDSVINSNFKKITNTKNLIIDLRNNGGGSDRSFEQLLPILYTNPTETVGVELLSTPRNNQRVKDFINNPNWSIEGKNWARKAYKKLSENEGSFVNLDSTNIKTSSFDKIYQYPKNVAILTNEQNASTTEQFLLVARQSTKVKTFGQTTFGALDISYTYPAKSPCGDFELIYCLSKSLRIPEMTIDNTGLYPDFHIYDDVPKYKWIDVVLEKLK